EAAIFLPTGTQANLVALLSHCERGEEYIVGQAAHNYLFEAGGAAVLGSIQPQPIDAAADGTLPLDKVAMKIKPDDIHFATFAVTEQSDQVGLSAGRQKNGGF
ncbi:beta-eliminating lyase-related protein, partial [Escherichia sp. SS-MK2]